MSGEAASRKRKRESSPVRELAFRLATHPVLPDRAGPVLVNFPSLSAPSTTPFKCYVKRHKKSDEQLLVVGETDAVEFESNEHETRRVADSGCAYLVAIHNKKTSSLTVLPQSLTPHVLTRTVKALKSIPPAPEPSAMEYFKAKTVLGETFGTKKAKAAIKARERNVVDVGAMEGSIGFVMAGIDKGAEGLMTKEGAKVLADNSRPIPPFNAETANQEEVYPLHGIIPEAEWKVLQVAPFYEAGTTTDRRQLLPLRSSDWVNTRVDSTLAAGKNKDRKRTLKIVFYISCMMAFRREISRKVSREDLSNRLSLVPDSVVDSLVSRFSQTTRDSTQPRSTPDLELRLLAHMLALCLHVDSFAVDHTTIAHDLAMPTEKISAICRNLGCKITKLGERERTRLGLPDSVADEKRAVLTAPVEFPKIRAKKNDKRQQTTLSTHIVRRMAAAMSGMGDTSGLSVGTLPELSLGSFDLTSQQTPAKLRVPSSSSGTSAQSSQPIATPSPPVFSRRTTVTEKTSFFDNGDDDVDGGADYGVGTPIATRPKRNARPVPASGSKGALTLRDQEKHIDNLKKENFNIKLRVHFLEERLAQLAPDQIDAALKQNISLKIEVQQRGMELKKLKKLVLELERELERLQKAGSNRGSSNRERERELEEKLEERERELRELRRRAADGAADALLADRNAELEDELDNMRGLVEDNMEELERLRDIVERYDNADNPDSTRVVSLENTIADLRERVEDQAALLQQREEEKDDLADTVEQLQLENEELQQQLQRAEAQERSESRAMILEEREERAAVEEDLNAARDKLAAALIELQQKEDEIEAKNTEIDNYIAEHDRVVAVVEDEWRGEVEEARGQVDELRDVLAERDSEAKDLRLHITELEANTEDLHAKFEAALAHLEEEAETKDRTIEKLGEQIYVLEDENDRMKEEGERVRDEEIIERERLEALSAALKDKVAALKMELDEMTQNYEECSNDIHAHRARQEELATHVEDLVAQLQADRAASAQAAADADAAAREQAAALRAERRTVEAKESALQSALADLARTQAQLGARDADLAAVQAALTTLEGESKRAGETHTTAKFSLELEVDRLKRDLERLESELARARSELSDGESRGRGRDEVMDAMHAEILQLKGEVSAQTQARLNVSERLDAVQASLKAAEAEVAGYKKRVADLEARLNKDQRALLSAESQYRDQLTERNTLLLTIYQYMDKILGVDKTPKKAGQAETKPFTNFNVFHDNLITRLKALSQIQVDFDKRAKDAEARFMERLTEMRKQLDMRWKQIDKFEAGVKGFADAKTGWKRKLVAKEGEVEALRTTNVELSAQLAGIRKPGQADSMELRALTARAANAERRLNNAQNQLLATEEKVASMNQKNSVADAKWEARVKEYEARLKAAEERVKRERQGGKERVAELESNLKTLQRQLELAQKRNQQLGDVVEATKIPTSSSAPSMR
ncbi:Rpa49 subunit specific to nuclear RNA polymerase I [Mycena indigotica]|uniref:Rpa49 subunit specific to nuclear RNA polymerase I n=1 Tax=Mycena indigotica TaxID=2126181 RepID=A0A8H6SG72_9AGAR|nr:Rpa49 subunit specific to nuclear RNA polymerase I [Mycena indigotica]KAF7297265.1 Rpa49 subunit specific to nuclear RNA polymerase I [Mycena indigotica]